ncbi:unnamed protein product [Urochloa decumbens]|uniref:FAD-binding PCMH-type domain-containing protein n=1 Tax=Urochloa decumbens TaxID=240449 RepID=A0ABC9DHT8_9POAL
MAVSTTTRALALLFCTVLCCHFPAPSSAAGAGDFLRCLSASVPSQLVLTPGSPSFTPVLASSIRNPRFFTPATPRPLCIVAAANASHVQAAVVCGRRHGVRLRVRSGGHDYEGLSYRSVRAEEFAVVDLAGLRGVRVDRRGATAWVDSGATVGELYYAVAKADPQLAFPAGVCPTIGVGGHFSGGGIGMMMRKHGLAADNVLDATLVDAAGRLLNKNTMGSDVFWAIRGGGGESFGVVLSWEVRLVRVPPRVTAFTVQRTIAQGAIDAVTKWQTLAPALPDELAIRVVIQNQQARFQSLFLGTCDQLLPVMSSRFPELGVTRADCREMTWLQSTLYINSDTANQPLETLLNRTTSLSTFTKNKSDYVKQAITRESWQKIFAWFNGPNAGLMILEPHGGQVSRIADGDTPYPYRSGVMYNIQHIAFWSGGDGAAATNWINSFYSFMGQFVTKNPRAAYVNYRDLDIGQNAVVNGVSTFDSGKVWGEKYFGAANFKRLAITKGKADPSDYFRNEQSVPPLLPRN